MNGGDFLDFNLLLFQIGHVYHVGKYNVSENVQNIEIYIFSFKKFLKNKCEISINWISAMKEYVYFLNAKDAFFEKNAYSELVSSGFIVTYIIRRVQLRALIQTMAETWCINLVSSVHGWLIKENTRLCTDT